MMQSYGSLAAVPVSATGKNQPMFVRIVCGAEWNRGLEGFLEFLNGPMMACRYTAHVGQAQNCHGQELDQPYGWIWN